MTWAQFFEPLDPPLAGETFDQEQDGDRLKRQLARVRAFMLAHIGQPQTLAAIAAATNSPEASVSARVRDLRKRSHGGWLVDRSRVPGERGLWAYCIRERRQKGR